MLIDTTYFSGSGLFSVPNIDVSNPVEEGSYNQLTAFIRIYEPELCRDLFGKTFYDAFIAGLAVTPTPETRWTTLEAKLLDKINLCSPIANYVWCKLWQQSHRAATANGDVILSASGMQVDGNLELFTQVYNQMVTQLNDFTEWFVDNDATYPEWEGEFKIFAKINIFGI